MSGAPSDAFVLANTRLDRPPACPEIELYLASEITPLWLATEESLQQANLAPPYWAFAWVGGQALARYILDNPAVVAGRRVLDFAAGCGIAAIAAALSDASLVEAAEIDAMAMAAIGLNARANGVAVGLTAVDPLAGDGSRWDVILAGDVCYERTMADTVFHWLRRAAAGGATVLMADPGRAYLPATGLLKVGAYTVPCSLDLEDRTSRDATVYRIVG